MLPTNQPKNENGSKMSNSLRSGKKNPRELADLSVSSGSAAVSSHCS